MVQRNPRSRKASDFNYSGRSAAERQEDAIFEATEVPVSSPGHKVTFGAQNIAFALSLVFISFGAGYVVHDWMKPDARVEAKYESLLQSAQLALKAANATSVQLNARIVELDNSVARLQATEAAFVKACAEDWSFSRACRNFRKVQPAPEPTLPSRN